MSAPEARRLDTRYLSAGHVAEIVRRKGLFFDPGQMLHFLHGAHQVCRKLRRAPGKHRKVLERGHQKLLQ